MKEMLPSSVLLTTMSFRPSALRSTILVTQGFGQQGHFSVRRLMRLVLNPPVPLPSSSTSRPCDVPTEHVLTSAVQATTTSGLLSPGKFPVSSAKGLRPTPKELSDGGVSYCKQ